MALCSHLCQEIFPKSSDKCAGDVLLLSKTCYLWGSIIGHIQFVLAGTLHRFHKNFNSFIVLFVKFCSSAVQSTLVIVTEPGAWMGCPITGKENMWLSSYRTPHFKSCACSKKYSLLKKSDMPVGFFELFLSRKCILLYMVYHYFKDTMNDNIFITISRKAHVYRLWTCLKWFAVENCLCGVYNNT